MKRSIQYLMVLPLAFVLIAQPSAAASARNLSIGPNSAVWLVGDSTLHPFTSRTAQLQASGLVDPQATGPLFDAVLKQSALKTFNVVIPVTNLKSKESALDKNMYKALKADTCPTISLRLSDYSVTKDTASADNFMAKVNGTLTIACQSQPVTLETDLTPGPNALHVQGHYKLLMTDYGIKPPTMMMGTIKVKDPVVIHFDLQLEFANPS